MNLGGHDSPRNSLLTVLFLNCKPFTQSKFLRAPHCLKNKVKAPHLKMVSAGTQRCSWTWSPQPHPTAKKMQPQYQCGLLRQMEFQVSFSKLPPPLPSNNLELLLAADQILGLGYQPLLIRHLAPLPTSAHFHSCLTKPPAAP